MVSHLPPCWRNVISITSSAGNYNGIPDCTHPCSCHCLLLQEQRQQVYFYHTASEAAIALLLDFPCSTQSQMYVSQHRLLSSLNIELKMEC